MIRDDLEEALCRQGKGKFKGFQEGTNLDQLGSKKEANERKTNKKRAVSEEVMSDWVL